MGVKHIKRIYQQLLHEFLMKSAIHGLKVFMLKTPIRFARVLWLLFMIFIIIWTHYIIVNLTLDYMQQPTEIHMSVKRTHVANTPFPGIAICSANKINRSKLYEYAEELFSVQQSYKPGWLAKDKNEMAEHVMLLTGFFAHPYDNFQFDDLRLQRLHDILTIMYNTTNYQSENILRELAPDCKETVIRGLLFGTPVSPNGFFFKRITPSSICCMFNYRRDGYATREVNVSKNERTIKFESNSVLNSVQFVLQNKRNEYTYTELSNSGFQLYVFPTDDFFIQSNTNGEVMVTDNSIVEIPIVPIFLESNQNIRKFSPQIRQCYFQDEGQKIINRTYYSLDECLMLCRMRSMIKYCGCVNPPWPSDLINGSICNLLDLPCLTRWKSVWYGWKSFDYVNKQQNSKELFEFENCGFCLPTCSGVKFKISVNDLPLRNVISNSGDYYSHGILEGLTNDQPLAVIKLFFAKRYAQATETTVVSDWVVLLNRYGGILSLIYGFSIISYIEIIYYSSGKWFVSFYRSIKHRKQQDPDSTIKSIKYKNQKFLRNYNLYWEELQPKLKIIDSTHNK